MRTKLLRPRREGLVVNIGVRAVVEDAGDNVGHRVVLLHYLRVTGKAFGEVRELLAEKVKSLVGPETGATVRQEGGEELLEHVVALENGTASICAEIDDELFLAIGLGTEDELGADALEFEFGIAGADEGRNGQDSNIVVAFALEVVAGDEVVSLVGNGSGIARSGRGTSASGGRGGSIISSGDVHILIDGSIIRGAIDVHVGSLDTGLVLGVSGHGHGVVTGSGGVEEVAVAQSSAVLNTAE